MSDGYTQQFDWAVRRLREEFGDDRVSVRVEQEGEKLTAAVAGGGNGDDDGEREPYVVLFKDPILGDVNRISDPRAFLEGEIGNARKWLAGESRQRRTYL